MTLSPWEIPDRMKLHPYVEIHTQKNCPIEFLRPKTNSNTDRGNTLFFLDHPHCSEIPPFFSLTPGISTFYFFDTPRNFLSPDPSLPPCFDFSGKTQ